MRNREEFKKIQQYIEGVGLSIEEVRDLTGTDCVAITANTDMSKQFMSNLRNLAISYLQTKQLQQLKETIATRIVTLFPSAEVNVQTEDDGSVSVWIKTNYSPLGVSR